MRYNTDLPPLLPSIQSCSSKFWAWSWVAGNFDKGWRGDHKHKIIDQPFMPKYGTVSQVLLQLVVAALGRCLKEHDFKYLIIWNREFCQSKSVVLEGKVVHLYLGLLVNTNQNSALLGTPYETCFFVWFKRLNTWQLVNPILFVNLMQVLATTQIMWN